MFLLVLKMPVELTVQRAEYFRAKFLSELESSVFVRY